MPADGLLLSAVFFVALYFLAPRGLAGGAVLHPRLSLLPVFCAWLWLGAAELGTRMRRAVMGGAVVLSLAALAVRAPVHAGLARQLDEYLSIRESVRPGSVLLPLCYARAGLDEREEPLSDRVEPFVHAASYLAVERQALDLANYEGNKRHFPLLFRPEVNPYTRMGPYGGIEGSPPCVEFLTYSERNQRVIDAVLTWGLEDFERRQAPRWRQRPRKHREERLCVESVKAQLTQAYELADYSRGIGRARLYRLRD